MKLTRMQLLLLDRCARRLVLFDESITEANERRAIIRLVARGLLNATYTKNDDLVYRMTPLGIEVAQQHGIVVIPF